MMNGSCPHRRTTVMNRDAARRLEKMGEDPSAGAFAGRTVDPWCVDCRKTLTPEEYRAVQSRKKRSMVLGLAAADISVAFLAALASSLLAGGPFLLTLVVTAVGIPVLMVIAGGLVDALPPRQSADY